jgi:hypothetical protein
MVLAAIVAVSIESYAAISNVQCYPSTLSNEMQGLEAAHETFIITIIGVAVVLLAVKWFGAESYRGTPGLLVKIGLYGTLVRGSPSSSPPLGRRPRLANGAHPFRSRSRQKV